MQLRWSVATDGGGTRDVVVRCPAGTTLADVVPLLLGPAAPTDTSVDGVPVAADAMLGVPPLLDGAALWTGSGRPARLRAGRDRPVAVRTVAGPDAGRVHLLPRCGAALVGRSGASDVVVADPRVSRHHGVLTLEETGVRLAVGTVTATSALGAAVTVGASRLRVGEVDPAPGPGALVCDGRGGLLVPRSVGPPLPTAAPELLLPRAPAAAPARPPFPLLAVLLPVVAAVALALWTGSWAYLLLAALGPLLVLGAWSTTTRRDRRERRRETDAHARACEDVRREAARRSAGLAEDRTAAMPDTADLDRLARRATPGLWSRDGTRPGDLCLRVGLATPVQASARSTAARTAPAGSWPGAAPAAGTPLLPRVRVAGAGELDTPDDLVGVDLADGPVAVVEPADPGLARRLVAEAVVHLPPGELVVVVLTDARHAPAWRWVRWLPHALPDLAVDPDLRRLREWAEVGGRPGARATLMASDDAAHRSLVAALEAVADCRAEAHARPSGVDATTAAARAHLLVVVDAQAGGTIPRRLLAAAPLGLHVLTVLRPGGSLPPGTATVVRPGSADGVDVLVRTTEGHTARATADRVPARWAAELARALAPLRTPGSGVRAAVPVSVGLTDLLPCDAESVSRRWVGSDDGLAAPLGADDSGPVVVDLAAEGPHALVAGTTGAGKSELLRTWLLALAASHPPSHVSFLLVDYKGGATFDDLARLPHTAGVLTDLDPATTTRALRSLGAEVRRRERLLARAGARDLSAYRRLVPGRPGLPALPRLLVVVDELRVLTEEVPDAVSDLVRLATTGRSLGLHLLLATQRPAGVVTAEVRANTGLRVALRVEDVADSVDVVERPDAAHLPARAPGRAVLVGRLTATVLQTAWSGAAGHPSVTVAPLEPGDPGAATGAVTGTARRSGAQGVAALVATLQEAAVRSGEEPVPAPYLPPLPDVLTTADLPAGPAGGRPVPGLPEPALTLGVSDLPDQQARGVLRWSPERHGPLAVLGPPRSGRSGALRAVARAAVGEGRRVVALSGTDPDGDHVADVLATLARPAGPGGSGGAVVLLLDDADALLDPAADPQPLDDLARLLQPGGHGGAHVVLAGGRALALSRLLGMVRARLVMAATDATDLALHGLPSGCATAAAVPGRCWAAGLATGPTTGLATGPTTGPASGPTTGPAAAAAAPGPASCPVDEVATDAAATARDSPVEAQVVHCPTAEQPPGYAPDPAHLLVPVPLPRLLTTAQLPVPARPGLPWGRRGPDGSPLVLATGPSAPRLTVLAGPDGSGRTAALAVLAAQARRAGVTTLLLRGAAGDGSGGACAKAPATAVATAPATAVVDGVELLLVDDADRLPEDDLAAVERWAEHGDGPLAALLAPTAVAVVGGHRDWFAGRLRGLPALARRLGRGVLLSPSAGDARDVLGLRDAPRQRVRVLGRGLHVERGRCRRVQVALAGAGEQDTPPGEV